ncbi:hypothetical protein K435DRAFT_582863, partial [Dendrothele bispora CBS 962.96]
MPRRPISRDLKARIPVLFYEQGMKVAQIRHVLGVGKTLVYDTLKFHNQYGVPYNPNIGHKGRPRILSSADAEFLFNLLSRRKTLFLEEIQELLLTYRGIHLSTPTILRSMRHLYFSRKRIHSQAEERNDLERSAWMNMIADLVPNPDMLMFTDEASRNRRTQQRRYG